MAHINYERKLALRSSLKADSRQILNNLNDDIQFSAKNFNQKRIDREKENSLINQIKIENYREMKNLNGNLIKARDSRLFFDRV